MIIADVGSNWKRDTRVHSLLAADEHIRAAAEAGCTHVKFQMFTHKELYGIDGDDTYSLPREWIPDLKRIADEAKIGFMCSAFSKDGYDFIDPYVDIHKIASAEATDGALVDYVARFEKLTLISNGAGFIRRKASNALIMDCCSNYPTKKGDFVFTGGQAISDHTPHDETWLAEIAADRGVLIFETHFTLSHDNKTPDEIVSRDPKEMKAYIEVISDAYKATHKRKNLFSAKFKENHARRYIEELGGYFRPKH
jgi:N-acetylneuraminate synthase